MLLAWKLTTSIDIGHCNDGGNKGQISQEMVTIHAVGSWVRTQQGESARVTFADTVERGVLSWVVLVRSAMSKGWLGRGQG
jgi:hypothetical protein